MDIVSIENLLLAWKEFVRGKRKKRDVQEFEANLMDNILELHFDLVQRTYHHGGYHAFNISDPKPRNIHKASVRDRLLHHAIYRILYPHFDKKFIADSYSCRDNKGTHKAMNRFRAFAYRASRNHTRTCWVLKCDIRKFFASIDQNALLRILEKYIADADILRLLREIIGSFPGSDSGLRRNDSGVSAMLWHSAPGKGLPLGNLTSQLLVNIYMSEFDQFVKHRLKAKYYIRYADDFIFLSHDRAWLVSLVPPIQAFLKERLKLTLHPDKLSLKTFASGVDFLGWVHFPDHRVLRTSAKRRMLVRVKANSYESAIASYEGLLKHGNVRKLCTEISRYRSK